MSLQSFSNQQRKAILPAIGKTMIGDFMTGKTTPAIGGKTITAPIIPVKKEKKKLTKWQWISKQLMKPVGIVATETEALGKFIGTGKAYIPGKAGLDILSGKREYSFGQMWTEYGTQMGMNPKVAGSIGFVFDIVADPFMFIGVGGLTKLGKLASKVKSLQKAGKVIKVGSKLDKAIKASGYTIKELVFAGTKAEQTLKGQRALITILGKPIIKGTKVFKATEKLKQIAGISRIGVGLRRTFTTKSGFKNLDELVDNYNNLAAYRKQQVLDEAIGIQKTLQKMDGTEIKIITEIIERPELVFTVKKPKLIAMANKIDDLFKQMKTTEKGKGILKTELENYFPHIKAKEKITDRIKYFFNPKKYSAALKAAKPRRIQGTIAEINARFGKEFFQSNPALAYAQRGLASAKAVTARELLDDVAKKFFVNAEDAPLRYLDSTNPLFKGLKAEPEVVRVIDQYIQGLQPEELKLVIRGYDRVLNWWKAQVLISPSYHSRNMFSNFWNNFLAGVKNPVRYAQARKLQSGKGLDKMSILTEAGETITGTALLKAAKERRVVGRGLYGADIVLSLADDIGGKTTRAKKLTKLMPWKQENILFKTNRAVGTAIEDNARLAHFIDKVIKGNSFDNAAMSVKKFLFDYEDLSKFERTILKRVLPFYTWTRKNIPLQFENLIIQPEKYAAVSKIIQQIEAGVPEPKTEKYMSEYITENVPVRIRVDEKGHTEYFLLGNWLPSASAIDFLSQPLQNIINMATPLLKTPFELWANKSLFFKNTLGESSKIEYYYKQPTEFIGIPMRRKTATLMRNIRILNDLNKLIKTPAKDEPENSWVVKLLNVLFGKAVVYDIKKARYFYQRETQERISELKAAIKKAKKMGKKEHAKKLQEELKTFRKERGR